jgi:hypothetical protein
LVVSPAPAPRRTLTHHPQRKVGLYGFSFQSIQLWRRYEGR